MAESRKYIDTPATVYDVVSELTDLAEASTEQEQGIAQAKAALAMESWMGALMQEMASLVVAHLEEPLLERLATMHDKLHQSE